jgi:tRNA (guanosine-2'-O-)-methyltransferase
VVATSSHENDCSLEALPLDQKTALVFGNEVEGISPMVMDQADAFMKIPMVGFTESLNISVSVAICIHTLSTVLRSSPYAWQLSESERSDTLIRWIHQTIKKPELVEAEFVKRNPD